MKKAWLVLLSVLLLFTSSLSVGALELPAKNRVSVDNTKGYTIETMNTDDGRIVKTYNPSIADWRTASKAAQMSDPLTYTKTVLMDLGMSPDDVESMPEENLTDFYNCESMQLITTYTKRNAEGETEILDEETALREVEMLDPPQDPIDPDPIEVPVDPGDGGALSYPANYTDEYMKIELLVVKGNDAKYHYSATAKWLTMPFYRDEDSFGICMEKNSVIADTRMGTYSYDVTSYSGGTYTTTHYSNNFTSSQLEVFMGEAGGVAVRYNLPDDIYYNEPGAFVSTTYSNVRLFIFFTAQITQPTIPVNFNVCATYCHRYNLTYVAPSFGISFGPLSIGFSTPNNDHYEKRCAILPSPVPYQT